MKKIRYCKRNAKHLCIGHIHKKKLLFKTISSVVGTFYFYYNNYYCNRLSSVKTILNFVNLIVHIIY